MSIHKRFLSAIIASVIVLFTCYSALADKTDVELLSGFKSHAIEKYYTNLGKWFSMVNDLKEKDRIITKPEQSDFKTLNRYLVENAKDAAQYSIDASYEFWRIVFGVDNKESSKSDIEAFNNITEELNNEMGKYNSSLLTVSISFDEQYRTLFEDNQISQAEYQGLLGCICTLNDIVQDILKIDSALKTE